MGLTEVFVLAVGLSMDAFAVSICKGISIGKARVKHALIAGIWFGVFQALMPVIGYFLGVQFERYIQRIDHWIALILLAVIGINMIREGIKGEEESADASVSVKAMFPLAVATSIDALAVGIAMACLEGGINIFAAISVIGVTTFFLCLIGVFAGNRFGNHLEKNASIAGGTILILIGIKILLEHLGILDRFFNWLTKLF